MANYLILAATSGIGSSLACQAKEAGHQLFLTGRRSDALAELAKETSSASAACELSDFDAVDAVFAQAISELGRLGAPDDVARAIAFLLDPANSWITGQVLGVDGGLARVAPKIKA